MHPHFPFSAIEILWTLTFAAQLVLLVVLIGRDRIRRFPWFTASVVLLGVRALIARVLYNRLPPLTFNAILISIGDLGLVIGLGVLVELARRSFASSGRKAGRVAWIIATLICLASAAAVLKYWGPWPAWKTLTADSHIATLLFMELVARKSELLVGVLNIEVGLVILLFGRRYLAGWHSHAQRIAVGLSTAALAQLGTQIIWQVIALHTKPTSQQEYDHVLNLRDNIFNGGSAVVLLVLIWWIAALWKDDPGVGAVGSSEAPDPGMLPALTGGRPSWNGSVAVDPDPSED